MLSGGLRVWLGGWWFVVAVQPVRVVDGDERGEGLAKFVVDDPVVLDVEPDEERLVEQAALLFIAPLVEPVGVAHEVQAGIDQPRLPRDFIVAAINAFFEVGSVTFDVVELLLDLGPGDVTVGGKFDQIGFLNI